MDSAKIYINGELLGYCKDPESFTNEMREKRRIEILNSCEYV